MMPSEYKLRAYYSDLSEPTETVAEVISIEEDEE